MKIFWIVCLTALIGVLLILAGYLLIGYVSFKISLSKNGKIKRTIGKNYQNHLKELGIDEKYFNTDFEKLEISSSDNFVLKGFYKNNKSNKIVILVHGFGGNHKEMTPFAQMFEKFGYDILAIDSRCHGESDGEYLTMGWQESLDLILWANKLVEINPQYKIVLFGLSMGATTVCMTVGEKIPDNIVLAIEDCGYDNAYKQFEYVYSKGKFRPKFVFDAFYNFTKKSIGFDLKKADAFSSLKHSKIPILFIHGSKDNFVPTENLNSLSSQVSAQRRHVYIAEEGGHAEAYMINPKKYENEVSKFLKKYYM